MNNNIEVKVNITRDYLVELIADNYTNSEILNLIIAVFENQGNQLAAVKELAANLELWAS